jgi:citrate lyase subunit beta/citryl-CoA lyase
LLRKVFEAGADAVILDLEDAVPAAHKGEARQLVAAALRAQLARASEAGPSQGARTTVK